MGVDVNIIIKNDFYELDDLEKSRAFVYQTIDKIKQRLHTDDGFNCVEIFEDYYCEESKWSEIIFYIRLLDVSIRLAKGYWSISPGCNICQVTNKVCGRLHIADCAFDMAMLLDAEEAWYVEDYLEEECYENSLEEMLEIARSREGIVEYPYAELMKYEDWQYPDIERHYHDSFGNLRKEYEELVVKCGDYKPTCIRGLGRGFVRVVKEGKINLLRRDTGSVVFDSEVDDVKDLCREILCLKDGKTALFDLDANPVIDFVNGEFLVSENNDYLSNRTIKFFINDEAQIKIMSPNYRDEKREFAFFPYKSEIVKRKPIKCPVCKGKEVAADDGQWCENMQSKEYYDGEILVGAVNEIISPDWVCLNCKTKFIKSKLLKP